MKYLIAWLVMCAVIVIGIGSINVPKFWRLSARGVSGQGTVTKLLPEMHATACYEYIVAGQKFEGQTQPWRPNPSLDQLHVGENVVVYYDPLHPE